MLICLSLSLENDTLASYLKESLINISIAYNFVTEFTSLVVTQDHGITPLRNLTLADLTVDEVHAIVKLLGLPAVSSIVPYLPPIKTGEVRGGGTEEDGDEPSSGLSTPVLQLNKLFAVATVLLLCTEILLS